MDYREFVEKQTGEIDITFGYSFPLTKDHVQAQAGMFRKIFANKSVKQDMNDFVQWQLTGYAEMNDDAMRACFENGATKELIDADKLAKIVAGCTTEISDITHDLMKANGITMDELHNSMTKDFEKYNQDTIIHCANIGMPHKLIAEFRTEDNYLDTLISYDFSKKDISLYMVNNHYTPFNEPDSENADRLLNYGFTANELIDMTPGASILFSDPRNCQTMLELGATPEHLVKSIFFAGNPAPSETIQILLDNGISVETLTDRYSGKALDKFCEQLESMGIEPKFSEQAIKDFDYDEHFDLSQKMFNAIDKATPFSDETKDKFLSYAFGRFDNSEIDFFVSKGVQIDDKKVEGMIVNIQNYWGDTYKLEQKATDVMKNITVNHKHEISPTIQTTISEQEIREGLLLKDLREIVDKVQFNQKLERKLPPKELSERPIPVAKKRQGQTWKI